MNTFFDRQSPMTKYLPAIVLIISLFGVSLSAEESYPPPTVMYQAPRADTVRVAETNGRGPEATLENVTVLHKQSELVEHPYFSFPGSDAAIVIDDAPVLNPTKQLTLAVWFKSNVVRFDPQKPLLLKSCPTHKDPFYQYGLIIYDHPDIVMDHPDHGRTASLVLSLGGKLFSFSADNIHLFNGWNHLAATFDGQKAVIYLNGNACETKAKDTVAAPMSIDRYPTPLVVGTYADLPRNEGNSFAGQISEFALWDKALTANAIAAMVAAQRETYPSVAQTNTEDSDYTRAVNTALAASEDIWMKEVLATGDPSYDKVKDYLRPLFYSTGKTNKDYAPHAVVLGLEDGVRPVIAASADGRAVYVDRHYSDNALIFHVGVNGAELFGESLDRLGETHWEDGWLPVLQTSYTTANGAQWRQELAALLPAQSGDALIALGRFELVRGKSDSETLRITLPSNVGTRFRASAGKQEGNTWEWTPAGDNVFYYAFAMGNSLPADLKVDADGYRNGKDKWCGYWRKRIENDGVLFSVPEKLVMDCQRNKLYQNLVLRWRYSIGCAVYDNEHYPWESGDPMIGLIAYGHPAEARKGLAELLQWEISPDMYLNGEKAAKLSLGVEYWHYTRDDTFIRERADTYRRYMRDFQNQMAADSNGLLTPERFSGDIPAVLYYIHHQAPVWHGMRDMARLLGKLGYENDASVFGDSAKKLRTNLAKAMNDAQRRLPDGTLFVPTELYRPETTVYDPVCATVLGSYWNLCMPYALCSGFWSIEGEEMDAILDFMRRHGSFLLGMVRFNYYPTEVGAYTPNGLAGYYTHGMDNVYLPPMLRVLTARNETDHLLTAFYSYLAHGMTRGTFMAGEGDSVGVYPGHFYRSMYGTFTNTQNAAFLQALRGLLIQETYNTEGEPSMLRLTPATPKVWLEDGKTISFRDAPTIFGPMSGKIVSHLKDNRINAEWTLPSRNVPGAIHWRLRLPEEKNIASVKVNGKAYDRFDPVAGVIDLTGISGAVSVEVLCR